MKIFKDDERFFGSVEISADLMSQELDVIANTIFAGCIVLECIYQAYTDGFKYVVWCRDFENVPLGAAAPSYMAVISKTADLPDDPETTFTLTRTWEKI